MRVLLVTGSYPPMRCGVGDYSQHLAQALSAEHGVKVGVLTSATADTLNYADGVEIFPIIKRWAFIEILRVIKVIRYWSPDIVHIQYPTQGYANGLLPWVLPIVIYLMGRKVVQTWHEGYGRRNVPELFLKSLVPSGLIFVRPQYQRNLHPQLRWVLWKKTIEFIPNASAIPRAELSEEVKREIKKQYLNNQKRLIVFFGFVYPHKGAELLFDIADPALDQIIIVGEVDKNGEYHREIMRCASVDAWQGRVTITGFLPAADVAVILAVADAVILPFRTGGGEWNTSIHGAVLNGAFVITTSQTQSGYDEKRNVYYAKIDDIQEMKSALGSHAGHRRKYDAVIDGDEWKQIAKQHCEIYNYLLLGRGDFIAKGQ